MPWQALISAGENPVDQATGSIITTVLGYGVTGVALLVLAVLYYKGWRLISPAREAEIRTTAREEARADLLKELERLERQVELERADKRTAEGQRDEALKFTRDQLAPLLSNFTKSTEALLPILQDVVRHREGGGDLEPRWRR